MAFPGACHYAGTGSEDDHEPMTVRRSRVAANAGLTLALLEGVVSLGAGVLSDLSWHELMDGFVVSNMLIGLSLAFAGYPIARVRPSNSVGWLLLAGGVSFAFSGAGYALLAWRAAPGETSLGWRLLADATSLGWPAAVGAFIPLALLYFPDGRLHRGAMWRAVVAACVVSTAGFELQMTSGYESTTSALHVRGYLRLRWLDHHRWLGVVPSVVGYVVLAAAFASLVLHYRRGDDRRRAQVLWLLLAALVMTTAFLASDVFGFETWFNIFVITLVPLAIAVAILRHQLLDIRLVVSRSVLYLSLTGLVVAAYAVIVAGTEQALSQRVPLGPPVLAVMSIAVAFNPVREFLQRRIGALFYGVRGDPVRAVAEIGSRLGETGLVGLLEGLCTSLRFPWAALEVDGTTTAAYGNAVGAAHAVPLVLSGVEVGRLRVGLRRGEHHLSGSDEQVLGLVTSSVAVALQATQYRDAIVSTREEERRRLGRELHDGVGPVLTGVILTADAARRLAPTDGVRTAGLLDELRQQATAAVDEIRRLATQLRPPVLDSLGLVGALEQHATMLAPLVVSVSGSVGSLPAAVEVAAYRIATEALTNVVHHSSASAATVSLRSAPSGLRLVVEDNGRPHNGSWVSGVGLTSMRERAAELGGTFEAGPGDHGGRVETTIPCGGA